MLTKYILPILILLPYFGNSQSIKGQVINNEKQALIAATVYWLGTSEATFTDNKGEFTIAKSDATNRLIASYVGYDNDTITVLNNTTYIKFKLSPKSLGVVTVSEKAASQTILNESIKTEHIGVAELQKGACCDLAGCFNTNASVQPATTNVITNAKELRMLGLSGVYNQILFDGFPLIEGLSYTYGVSAIPGPLVGNIFIAKGANSNLQGAASISGQINVIPKSNATADKLFINAFVNSFGENQYNAIYKYSLGKRKLWKASTAAHQTLAAQTIDKDNDNFIDVTKLNRTFIQQRFEYGEEKSWGWHLVSGLQYWSEDRTGGQKDYDASKRGSDSIYGQFTKQEQYTAYTKVGYRFDDNNMLQLFASHYNNTLESDFGLNSYNAEQNNSYLKLQFDKKWRKHNLKFGTDANRNYLPENININANNNSELELYNSRKDMQAGIFAENTFNWYNDKLLLITSIRHDIHKNYSSQTAPRALFKYDFSANMTFRTSVGYGYRIANVFAENPLMLSGHRAIIINEKLKPEEAWNYGINALRRYKLRNINGYFSADLYHTRFQNQIFPDYNQAIDKVYLSNHTDGSYSTAFQFEITSTWFELIEAKVAYNYLDVSQTIEDKKVALPFISKHTILATLSYESKNEKWQFDANYHWYGVQKLPLNITGTTLDSRPESNPFQIINLQATKKWKKFELYGGCENLLDFRQKRPFVGWENPFNSNFDPTSAWGPTRGREYYLGFRFIIK